MSDPNTIVLMSFIEIRIVVIVIVIILVKDDDKAGEVNEEEDQNVDFDDDNKMLTLEMMKKELDYFNIEISIMKFI
ncbi:774_t:CDS:2 [Entrophospora sp. SA101]|nr:14574_t:CDS:2 [Entrophospora sp. SA101]CAJ0769380.1 774_t:CDS:2 [Entrophospora sp. SA101]CAJ0835937.1 14077_t:CDS:2 [Entrophospora sp. SA101]CAJ0924218.1 17425_t:CDS:2 [Entrophospora sp. SA101]